MYPRTSYEMTEDDLKTLLAACKPTPVIMIGSYVPAGPQENANHAWAALGRKMGFDYTTVRPVDGKGTRSFTAIPSETESVRTERLEREAEEKRQADITRLREEIEERQAQLNALENNNVS